MLLRVLLLVTAYAHKGLRICSHLIFCQMIEAHEVDFWDRDAEQLELMEERRMYPPRFTVCVTGSSATGPSSLQVKFAGSQQKLNTEIMLPYVRREGT